MMIDVSERERSTNRSLERALHLLLVMETLGRPQNLTELSLAVQLAKPTVQRILSVLERYHLVEKRQGRYHLGVGILPLAHGYLLGNDLSRAALPVLQELAVATGETASLFVRLGFHRVVVQRVEGANPLRYVLPIGQRLPLHLGVGKVLAAAMPEKELMQIVDGLGEMHHPRMVPLSKAQLLEELTNIRKQGYAISSNECELNVASVSAPIKGSAGDVVAAVSIAGMVDRLSSKTAELLIEVNRAAQAISDRVNRI